MLGKMGKLENMFGVTGRSGWLMLALASFALLADWLLTLWFVVPRYGQLGFLRLHYTASLGVDWVAEWWKLFIYPACGTLAFFVNGRFAGLLSKKHRMFGLLVLGATAVVEVLIAAGTAVAVMLNI